MDTQIVVVDHTEGTGAIVSQGVFLVAEFEPSELEVVRETGWGPQHRLVVDLKTGVGGLYRPGGDPFFDVCQDRKVGPLFASFMKWLYGQGDPWALPAHVTLEDFIPATGPLLPAPGETAISRWAVADRARLEQKDKETEKSWRRLKYASIALAVLVSTLFVVGLLTRGL